VVDEQVKMVKANGLYYQTKWVEDEIKRNNEVRMLKAHTNNFEHHFELKYGSKWRQMDWEGLSRQSQDQMKKYNELKKRINTIQELMKNPDGLHKPPPLRSQGVLYPSMNSHERNPYYMKSTL
jgi:arsenate reductase-like glutaredoxin family protein